MQSVWLLAQALVMTPPSAEQSAAPGGDLHAVPKALVWKLHPCCLQDDYCRQLVRQVAVSLFLGPDL